MNRYLALFLLVIIIECSPESEESSSEQTSIISPSQPATPVSSNNTNSTSNGTELVSPNLNEGSINFEEVILSFTEQDIQPSNRTSGNWGRFGGIGSVNLSIEYFDNPDNNDINESSRVIKVTEPSGIQSWA